jgi:tellurite resistance protein TerC
MGLRQLYFLLGGLMNKLIYLNEGLSVILGFIGIKLVLEAIHGGGTHNILGVHVPEISTQFSLAIIVTTLLVTIIASLARTSKSKVAE